MVNLLFSYHHLMIYSGSVIYFLSFVIDFSFSIVHIYKFTYVYILIFNFTVRAGYLYVSDIISIPNLVKC